jgi:hypothetical protein
MPSAQIFRSSALAILPKLASIESRIPRLSPPCPGGFTLAAVESDDDARVSHGPLPPLGGARACAA